MREIKFRCWNVYGSVMHDWDVLVSKNKIHLLNAKNPSYKIMQYTGMKDKNGVEIYEGDIVKISECDKLKVVEWNYESCCFVFRCLPNHPYSENFFMDDCATVEVIGNIHQNPELLEVE